MQHPDEGTIHAWLDGELSAEEVAALEAHVAECAECSTKVAEARGFIAASSRIVSALDIVPAGVIPIATQRVTRAWYTGVQFRAAAAVVVVAAASLLLLKKGGQENAARTRMVTVDTGHAEAASAAALPAAPVAQLAPVVKSERARRVAQAPSVLQKKKDAPQASSDANVPSAREADEAAKPIAQGTAPEKRLDATGNMVVAGGTMADAVAPALVAVKSDTLANSVRNVYEVSPGVQVTLVETSLARSNFSAASSEAKARRLPVTTSTAAPAMPPATSPAPTAAPTEMRRKLPINTITWTKGTRVMTLTGAMSIEELTAIRMRLPEDKR